MAGEVLYLDASALVKLVVLEPQSAALAAEVGRWQGHVTSVVGAVEVRRAARRAGASAPRVDRSSPECRSWTWTLVCRSLRVRLDPPELRTLDALHLASAISLEDDLGAFACYDERLANAAAREGLRVLAPA